MTDDKSLFTNSATERPVRDASTVILIRPGAPFEVFLVRRHQKSAFMGGMFVFPGGKLDDADSAPRVLARCGDTASELRQRMDETPGRPVTDELAAALGVAACRELFEEAGVLLARRRGDTDIVCFDGGDAQARFTRQRAALRAEEKTFADLLEEEDLELDLGGLAYYAHWITPSQEPRRYDTRFFVAALPPGQVALIDQEEVTEQTWRSPASVLEAHAKGEIGLAPPTMRTLEELAECPDLSAVEVFARGRAVAPLLPKVAPVDDKIGILLPWDPLYAEADGEGLDLGDGPHPMSEPISRIVLDDGRWISVAPST